MDKIDESHLEVKALRDLLEQKTKELEVVSKAHSKLISNANRRKNYCAKKKDKGKENKDICLCSKRHFDDAQPKATIKRYKGLSSSGKAFVQTQVRKYITYGEEDEESKDDWASFLTDCLKKGTQTRISQSLESFFDDKKIAKCLEYKMKKNKKGRFY